MGLDSDKTASNDNGIIYSGNFNGQSIFMSPQLWLTNTFNSSILQIRKLKLLEHKEFTEGYSIAERTLKLMLMCGP